MIAINACPCGFYSDAVKQCACSFTTITRYQKRLSGPLLDRIDIHIEVPRVDYDKLRDDRLGEQSADVQKRVETGRETQSKRPAELDTITCNADMGSAEVRIYWTVETTPS